MEDISEEIFQFGKLQQQFSEQFKFVSIGDMLS